MLSACAARTKTSPQGFGYFSSPASDAGDTDRAGRAWVATLPLEAATTIVGEGAMATCQAALAEPGTTGCGTSIASCTRLDVQKSGIALVSIFAEPLCSDFRPEIGRWVISMDPQTTSASPRLTEFAAAESE